jgi:hypothetical protein
MAVAVMFFGFVFLFQTMINQSRIDNFLIDQCANERTVSVVFADGSRTHCLAVAP